MRIPPYTSRSMARMQEAQRELWAPPVVCVWVGALACVRVYLAVQVHRQRLEMRAQMMEQVSSELGFFAVLFTSFLVLQHQQGANESGRSTTQRGAK